MYIVRKAESGDCEAIMSLIKELAAYVNCEDEVKINADTLRRDGFGSEKLFHCVVAELEKDIIGYVLYYYTYSPWVGKSVYMEDFYVKPNHRSKGVGTSLWKAAIQDAFDNNCKQMEWAVLNWNTSAVEYYKRKGGTNLTEAEQLHVYRFKEEDMRKMLGNK